MNNFHEVKNFDVMLQKDEDKQKNKTSHTYENACKKKVQILQSGPQNEMVPDIWKEVQKCYKMNHFKEVCRSSKSSMIHNMEKEAD